MAYGLGKKHKTDNGGTEIPPHSRHNGPGAWELGEARPWPSALALCPHAVAPPRGNLSSMSGTNPAEARIASPFRASITVCAESRWWCLVSRCCRGMFLDADRDGGDSDRRSGGDCCSNSNSSSSDHGRLPAPYTDTRSRLVLS